MADAAFAAGQTLTASALDSALNITRWRIQKATQSVSNSTVLVSSNDLQFSIEANATYVFQSQIAYSAGTSSNFSLGWSLPGGVTLNYSDWCNAVGGNANNSPIFHDWITTNPLPVGGGTNLTLRPSGRIITTATPGTFVWTFAQVTAASTSSAQLLEGSWVSLTKVS